MTLRVLFSSPLVKASEAKCYYPPTYPADGFTHATADPKYLLTAGAKHFSTFGLACRNTF